MALPRRLLSVLLTASLAGVAVLTLTPEGSGWAWGSPITELRWYLGGLGSAATDVQLLGNLALLAPAAALSVLRWPALGRFGRLTGLGLAMGTSIELIQRLVPLGRVVSPMDAVLNATGVIAAGMLTAQTVRPASAHRVRAITP